MNIGARGTRYCRYLLCIMQSSFVCTFSNDNNIITLLIRSPCSCHRHIIIVSRSIIMESHSPTTQLKEGPAASTKQSSMNACHESIGIAYVTVTLFSIKINDNGITITYYTNEKGARSFFLTHITEYHATNLAELLKSPSHHFCININNNGVAFTYDTDKRGARSLYYTLINEFHVTNLLALLTSPSRYFLP